MSRLFGQLDQEAWSGGRVGSRGAATFGVPAQNLVGEARAPHGVRSRGDLHPPGRHLENVPSAGLVEHVRPLEEACKRLAVLAVADEAEASRRGDGARDAAHAAAPAKREVHYDIVAFDIGPNGCGINATRVEILSRRRFIHQLGTFAARSGPA